MAIGRMIDRFTATARGAAFDGADLGNQAWMIEQLDAAATRVWCMIEAVKKAGLRQDIGVVLATPQAPQSAASGWVVLGAGAARIATLVAPVAGFADPVAFAVLVAGQ